MRPFVFSLIVAWLSPFLIFSQNTIQLTINHKLGNDVFMYDETVQNNLEHDFKVQRLEYYISEISLIHDAGQETKIEDLWVLANASSTTEVTLGEYDINEIEKIMFHIGVDSAHNHLDPAMWHATHPLAPKSPSMHWGWIGGYRFVAFEGDSGENMNQLFELHGLGDENYFQTEVELNVSAENNVLDIQLDADYTEGLRDIEIDDGLIVHGPNFEAKKCLENFRDHVFSPSSNTNSIQTEINNNTFNLYPNPIVNGITTISLDLKSTILYNLVITSSEGKQFPVIRHVKNNQTIDFSNFPSGLYYIQLQRNNETILTRKVIVE